MDAELGLKRFYAEHRPRFSLAVFWKILVTIVGDARKPVVRFRLEDFEDAVTEEWPREQNTRVAALVHRLRPFFAWPDGLAVLYANRYRSAFAANYLTAALAVCLALLPVAFGEHLPHGVEFICIVLELAAIGMILLRVWRGRRNQWHERWIDYRLAAELVRHLRIVAPLGGRRLLPQVQAHRVTYGQPAATWMAWYVRAVERWLGLPIAVLDRSYLIDYLTDLEFLVKRQLAYHETTVDRCHNMETRLHRSGIYLLRLTVGACLLHLIVGSLPGHSPWHAVSPVLTFLCGFFPALGAAFAAISEQGEFRSLTKQSQAMCDQLAIRLAEIRNLLDEIVKTPNLSVQQFSTRVDQIASATADLLVKEVLDWRSVVLDQPLRTSV